MCDTEVQKKYSSGALYEDLIFLTDSQRMFFMVIFAILLVISTGANTFAIYTVIKRNTRFLQKASLISLALSDLLMTAAYSSNNMETFSHVMVNWTMGAFMCSFNPTIQIVGLAANLFSIVVIALDRYVNVVKALSLRWNPSPLNCTLGFLFLWTLSFLISWPIYHMFDLKELVVYRNSTRTFFGMYEFCVTDVKDDLRTYYTCIAVLVFSTLLVVYLGLNYSVAKTIWSHRKPIVQIHEPQIDSSSSSAAAATSCEETASTNVFRNMTNNTMTTLTRSDPIAYTITKKTMVKHEKMNQQKRSVQRKIRTFKIIVFCMIVFTVCRLPFWVFNIIKLSYVYNRNCHWLLLYGFNALALSNCAINPFLYVFLNTTLKCCAKFFRGVKKMFKVFCLIGEFDYFEKDKYPFCDKECGSYKSSFNYVQDPMSNQSSKRKF